MKSYKVCSWCREKKSKNEFYIIKDKLHSHCKECVCQQSRHTRNPERYPMPKRNKRKTKICPVCKQDKPFSAFSPRKRKITLDGISSWCKKCTASAQKVRRIKHPPKKQPYDPVRNKVNQARRSARKNKAGGFFTAIQWEKLKFHHDFTCLRCKKKEPDINLTADHVIPISKGGTSNISNIQPLCRRCNSVKYNKIIDYR